MIELRRDKEGFVVAYKDGKYVGRIITMGDNVKKDGKEEKKDAESS